MEGKDLEEEKEETVPNQKEDLKNKNSYYKITTCNMNYLNV